MASATSDRAVLRDRLEGALWGIFVADALAMPCHWYYNTESLAKTFGRVTDYMPATDPHPEAFTDDMDYAPSSDAPAWDFMHAKRPFFRLHAEPPKEHVPAPFIDAYRKKAAAREATAAAAKSASSAHGGAGDSGGAAADGGGARAAKRARGEGKEKDGEGGAGAALVHPRRGYVVKGVDEHGNHLTRPPDKRTHYHTGLRAGDNTAQPRVLVRMFMRHVVEEVGYDADAYLRAFIKWWTTPGANTDTYSEIYVRRFFERLSFGMPPRLCAIHQYDVWSVGSHSGLQPSIVMALLRAAGGASVVDATEAAVRHTYLTHNSINVEEAARVIVPLLLALASAGTAASEDSVRSAVADASARVHAPARQAGEWLAIYREYKGPGGIPLPMRWKMHREVHAAAWDPAALVAAGKTDAEVVGLKEPALLSSMCYTEFGVPAVLYFAWKYAASFEEAVVAQVQVGGDNTGRGAILGAVMGAAYGKAGIPRRLLEGLAERDAIQTEIDSFLDFAFAHGADDMEAAAYAATPPAPSIAPIVTE